MTENSRWLEITNYQIILTYGVLLGILVSLLISYNEKLNLENKPPLLSEEESQQILYYNRIFLTIIVLFFLYFSYETLKLTKEGNDLDNYNDATLQFYAALLASGAALISTYVVIKNHDNHRHNYNETEVIENENPEL